MLSSASSVAPKPAALPPAAQLAQPGPAPAGGPSFAQFLNDQPELPPAHAEAAPHEADKTSEPAAPAPAPATARRKESSTTPARPATPPAARAAESAAATGPTNATGQTKAAKASEDGDDAVEAATDDGQDTETSGLNEFTQIIGLALPTQQATTPAPVAVAGSDAEAAVKGATGARGAHGARAGHPVDAAEGEAATSGDTTASDAGSKAERRPTEAGARAADASPRAKGIELAADKAAAARSAGSEALQQAGGTKAGDSAPRAVATPDTVPPSFAAVLAQALPAATAPAASATPAPGQVHAALHSSAFAPELAASVSLLAVDGVQQAELQLNPADMGPVAVQIVVDGAQAQVSFHAVQAETRQALEQSLPDLAAALQGQGLTLSGGGVFQQSSRDAQGGQGEAGGAEGRGSRVGAVAGSAGGSTAAAAPVRRAVGLLDTFA